MVRAKLYVEGGSTSAELMSRFREGWHNFFESAGLHHNKPRVVPGRGREDTLAKFRKAVAKPETGTLPLLLVDSEGPVRSGFSVWQHLQNSLGQSRPAGASDDQAFLMAQVMETWFLADRGSLKRYSGASFREDVLENWPHLEMVPKDTVFEALEAATASCGMKYTQRDKAKFSYRLIGQLDAGLVEDKCPHAKELLLRLRAL